MPDHSSDAARPATRAQLRAEREAATSAGASAVGDGLGQAAAERGVGGDPAPGHVRRTDWRLGGRTVMRWREWLLAGALISLGVGILAGTLIDVLWQSRWAAASATALLWASMVVPALWALSLSRPAGLLRFRAVDVLYGVVLGGMLRVIHGWIEQATEGSADFPAYTLIDGRLGDLWWATDLVAVVAVAPLIEEFFFRAVILVSVFTILRRPLGHAAAGIIAVVAGAATFVLVHSATLGASPDRLLATFLLGLVCGALVTLTGRIWGAVLVHAIYNATYVVLALAGTFLV